jgi:hypothetical protein
MKGAGVFLLVGLLLALGLAVASPWASKAPDGLEKVSEKHGFAPVETSTRAAPMENYWEERGPAFKIVAGGVGTLLVFGLTLGLGRVLAKKKQV